MMSREHNANQGATDLKARVPPVGYLAIACVVVIALWYMLGYVLPHQLYPDGSCADAPTLRGVYGDMFGSVNALFSALAFAGVLYTIVSQRAALHLQSEELRRQTLEALYTRQLAAQPIVRPTISQSRIGIVNPEYEAEVYAATGGRALLLPIEFDIELENISDTAALQVEVHAAVLVAGRELVALRASVSLIKPNGKHPDILKSRVFVPSARLRKGVMPRTVDSAQMPAVSVRLTYANLLGAEFSVSQELLITGAGHVAHLYDFLSASPEGEDEQHAPPEVGKNWAAGAPRFRGIELDLSERPRSFSFRLERIGGQTARSTEV